MISGLSVALGVCALLIPFVRESLWAWVLEFVMVLFVVFVFWEINIYLAICVLVFHGLNLIQLYHSQGLLGTGLRSSSLSRKVQAGLLVIVLFVAVGIELIKGGHSEMAALVPISTKDIVALANGEIFPYIVGLCLMASLLMFGLVAERKRR